MKGLPAVIFALLFCSFTVCGDSQALQGVYSPRNLKIDGKLSEKIWQQAPLIKDFITPEKRKPQRPTEVKVVFTPQAVVFGFKSCIKRSELQLIPTERDRSTTSCDCVEIMLDTTGGADSYRHFIVNAANGVLDRLCEQGGYVGDIKWNGEFSHAVFVADDFWSCEIALPYRTLGITQESKHQWSINLARESFNVSANTQREVSSISSGNFNIAGEFRKITVPPQVNLDLYRLDLTVPEVTGSSKNGSFVCSVESVLQNLSGKNKNLRAECRINVPQSLPVCGEQYLSLQPRARYDLSFKNLQLGKPGIYSARLILRDCDSNRIVLKRDFTIDAQYVPIKINLIDPHYRNAIFATQNLKTVKFSVTVDLPEDQLKKEYITAGIKLPSGKILMQKQSSAQKELLFEFPVAELPEEKMLIFVKTSSQEVTCKLRKLPYKASEVWRGKCGNWFRNGKKIFINSGWVRSYTPAYNILIGEFGADNKTLFYNIHTYIGISTIKSDLIKNGELSERAKEFFRRKVNIHIDNPYLFGHFLCDEPDVAGYTAESFRQAAEFIADIDPYHPIMISPGSGFVDFAAAAEISGFHCYPHIDRQTEMKNFNKIVVLMDKAMEHFKKFNRQVTVTYLHQGFDYSDSGNTNTRIPTYDEFRSQNLLSLILGSKGLMHYNRCEENYPELYLGMDVLVREQQVIGEEAIIQDDPPKPAIAAQAHLRLLAKYNKQKNSYWVLACNTSLQAQTLSFDFEFFGNQPIYVLSEKRQVESRNGRVTDHFKPFEVHVYTTDPTDFGLVSVQQIKQQIKDVYTKRRLANRGNLIYQEFENHKVKVSASSNKFAIFRAENSLWHIADGITDGKKPCDSPGGSGVIHWSDNTPDKYPDWLLLEFNEPLIVGRVEIYSVEKSLSDYEVQLLVNGQWQTVASVTNARDAMRSLSFKPRKASALRLWVTKSNERFSRIYEIKIFNQ